VSASRPKTYERSFSPSRAGPGSTSPSMARSTPELGSPPTFRSHPGGAWVPCGRGRAQSVESSVDDLRAHVTARANLASPVDAQGDSFAWFSMSPWPIPGVHEARVGEGTMGATALPFRNLFLPHRDRGRRRDRGGYRS